MVGAVTSQREGSNVQRVCSRCSRFLPQSRDMQVWLIGGSELPVGAVVEWWFVCVCVSFVIDCRPVEERTKPPTT